MSTLKKILALSLALAMILSVSVFAGYTTDSYKDAAAIDKDAAEAVELLYALDIMTGDEKGNFNPNATITRAEVAKMIYVILNKGNDDKAATYAAAQLFTDVPSTAWYAGYINYLAALGLVSGSEGKFYPTAAVKTAEAAKMLLTAIGYNATDRQYVGANWAKNVLSDASIVGLLSGYKADINGAAPRQWVAVMFKNALMDAWTYETVVPAGFNGIFNAAASSAFIKFGKKYYNLYDNEVYAIATPTAALDKVSKASNLEYAAKGKVLFSDGEEFKSTGLGYMDLGQKYRVIARGDKALSVRPVTSVVADDVVANVSYKLSYATGENKVNNKYVFTVADMEARLNGGEADVLTVKYGNNGKAVTKNAADVKSEIDAAGIRNDAVRAIDKDGDGDIDYIIYTCVNYAEVTKVGESKEYGAYIQAKDVNGNALKVEGGSYLYLNDVIISNEEFEKGNFIKFAYNFDEGMFNVEILPVIEAAEFDSRQKSKSEYTFAGETYVAADNGFDLTYLNGANVLGYDFDIVVDGDLLVYAVKTDDNYSNIDDVNARLALLIDHNIGNKDRENVPQVKLMTIDGNIEWYWYDSALAAKKGYEKFSKTEDELKDDTLYIYRADEDGYVTLEEIDANAGNLKTNLVTSFERFVKADAQNDERGDLTVKTSSATYTTTTGANYRVARDNKFFAKVEGEYMIITVSEDVDAGKYLKTAAQAMIKSGTYYNTFVGGYLDIDEAEVSGVGYLWVVDGAVRELDDDTKLIKVMFSDSEEAVEIEVPTDTDAVDGWAYKYSKNKDGYTLTGFGRDGNLVAVDGELWDTTTRKAIDLDQDLFLITVYTKYRTVADGLTYREVYETEFVTADEILAAFDEMDTDTYDYVMSYDYDKNSADVDIFYLVVERTMIDVQPEGYTPGN
ncbi:MAG: S-layer homology domain-containing protein [Clostridia bacterium]|nr:S-layer homology domain-containing protein [Clostridia bacterium]